MKDKVAIVTGANSGIGKATARRFAHEGARVILADLVDASQEAKAIAAQGGEALAVKTDVRDEAQVIALFARTLSTFGRIDILVNSAGIVRRVLVAEATLEDWDALIGVNLKGTFLCCKAAIPAMRQAGGGVIVNIASDLGLVGAPHLAIYGATKGAVIQFTRGLAAEYAADKIRVNCVCPGPIDTPMLRGAVASAADPEARLRANIESTILRRLGRPEEIANVIHFLASDEASFMTGSIVAADGGVTAI